MRGQQRQRQRNRPALSHRAADKSVKSRRVSALLLGMIGMALAGACLVILQSLRLPSPLQERLPQERLPHGQRHTAKPPLSRTTTPPRLPNDEETLKNTNSASRTSTDAGVGGLDDPALYEAAVDLQGDSSTATVMGVASGYSLPVYQRFVGSLRRTGYKGHIILGVSPDVDPAVLAYFRYRQVTPKILSWVNCTYENAHEDEKTDIFKRTTCSHPYPDIKIRWSRFPLARDWLEECTSCTGPVLVMDVRDAYFQLDPFGPGSPPIAGLQVFQEHASQTTGHWLVRPIVKACKGIEFVEPMLCSGTTIGTRAAVLKYLEAMYAEMKVWINTPKCRFQLNGDDQTIHNLLFYTNQLPFAKAIPNRQGIVNTVGVEGSIHFKAKREKFMAEGMLQGDAGKHPYPGATDRTWIGSDYGVANADGLFTQEDGTVSRVIHQFDRYGVGYTIWLGQQPFVKDPLPDGAAALLPHVKPPHGAPPDAIRRVTDAGVDVSDPSLFETVDLQGDSSTATVMGMASGYNLGIYKRFVGSLRKSGFKGHIILGVAPDVASNVLDYFEYRGVTPKILKWVNCTYASDGQEKLDIFKRTTCSDPYPDIKIRWSRFPLQRDWLRDCETCTGPVLIMDVRDSYFQLDPFGPGSGPIKGLQVFEEHPSQTTGHWLVKNIVEQCKDTSFIKPMLCSGTTIGTRAAMLKYLEAMYEEMKVWITTSKCRFNLNGDDQTIHNYLYYTEQLPFATAIPNRMGIVNTVGVQGAQTWHAKRLRLEKEEGLDENQAARRKYPGDNGTTWIGTEFNVTDAYGFFTQYDGARSRVIHQYDRWGMTTTSWLSKQDFVNDARPVKA